MDVNPKPPPRPLPDSPEPASPDNRAHHSAARPIAGIAWMVATGLCFVAMSAVVKHSAQDLPPAQAAFLRFLMGLLFIPPVLGALLRARLDRRAWALFVTRGVAHTCAVLLWFYALARIPMAEVTALNYMAPVYVTMGAALFLGERLAARRIGAMAVAFAGALVILRPGFRDLDPGHVAMVASAVFFGVGYLVAKKMSGEVSASVVVAMLSITATVGLAPFAALVWVPPTLADLMWMFVVACLATLGHYTMTLAFAAAPVTLTQPVTFLQLLWSALLGWWIFDESVDAWVIVGGGAILAAVSFMAWREAVLKRHAAAG